MIRFERRPKPEGFEERVEGPGAAWLKANATGRPPAHWREFRPQLADAFGSLCAYCAMFEPVGTVDHFVSVDEDRSKSYDWTNYRFSSGWINSSKQSLRSTQVIDPFAVTNEWFEVQLPSMQLVLTDHVPPEERERAQFVLDRLHLGHDERVVRQRREWYRMYQDGELDLIGLRKKAPLIAAAVKKQEIA
ncbi:hypothetical protein [Sorangium cellulosum]|uniref:HNH nuclease domain-containing protein n=1 Tax=Sorangium cellulosum So0157-2 TaxID=1254432 RepID=S4XRI6_SORCE|nr:hypothetical protein [Sorangium cellulosum]AGP34450.1 hypothetical protein SCE1572_07970 [Sorangium cellulosum So0157-2]